MPSSVEIVMAKLERLVLASIDNSDATKRYVSVVNGRLEIVDITSTPTFIIVTILVKENATS